MVTDRYILDDKGEPVAEPDLFKWAKWFEQRLRVVKQEYVGKFWVSTVFLGLDHRFSLSGPPILWETMVFNKKRRTKRLLGKKYWIRPHRDCQRCSGSREQALAMHEDVVNKVKKGLIPDRT